MIEQNKCKWNPILWILYAVFFAVVLVVVTVKGGYYDFVLSTKIGSDTSFYGWLFANLGDFPSYMAAPVSFTILFHAINNNNTKWYHILRVVFVIFVFVGNLLIMNWISENFFNEELLYLTFYKFFGAIVLTLIDIFATIKVDKKLMRRLMVFAIFFISIMAFAQLFVAISKVLWARLRFRNMIDITSIEASGFTPWYILNFTSEGREHLVKDGTYLIHDAFKSFPSGHTCAAGVTFVIILLPDIFKKLQKYKVAFYIVPFIFTVLVAISRVVNKAHYLSDTLFGGTIVGLTAVFGRHIAHYFYDFENEVVKKRKKAIE